MNDLNGYDIEDLHVGMSATFSKTITEADIVLFAGVSGDSNAIHINEEYAATTAFKGRIAHGFLSASVISAAVANHLPGPGAIYLDQRLTVRSVNITFVTLYGGAMAKLFIVTRYSRTPSAIRSACACELLIYGPCRKPCALPDPALLCLVLK